MKKRTFVKILSFSLGVSLALGIYALKTGKENNRYVLEIENTYSYMLDELTTATNNISDILNKARFATSPARVSNISAQLFAEAELSKSALAQLPVTGELAALNRFYSQVGNYAIAVSKNLIEKGEIEDTATANIEYLSSTAKKVAEVVNDSRAIFNNPEYWAKHIESQLTGAINSKSIGNSLGETEEELKDYPTLIYDGPYSDHITQKEPTLLKDTAAISKTDARLTAAKYAQTNKNNLEYAGNSKGKIKTYDYLGVGLSVSVTAKGGHTLFMRKEREIQDMVLTNNLAVEKAKRYLEKMGVNNMQETYYYESDGVCTVNFAYLDGKTLCYTDLIKVGVAMDDGEIVFYEAAGFISNHTNRAFETPKYSESEARKKLSGKLTVEDSRLALIPTSAVDEQRCYEFACVSADGQEILVYINTATLAEEEILILSKSDGGVLVK